MRSRYETVAGPFQQLKLCIQNAEVLNCKDFYLCAEKQILQIERIIERTELSWLMSKLVLLLWTRSRFLLIARSRLFVSAALISFCSGCLHLLSVDGETVAVQLCHLFYLAVQVLMTFGLWLIRKREQNTPKAMPRMRHSQITSYSATDGPFELWRYLRGLNSKSGH